MEQKNLFMNLQLDGVAADKEKGTKPAGCTPPGIQEGMTVAVHYSGRSDETWLIQEAKGHWVRITFQGRDYWTNFDNVVYYSFPEQPPIERNRNHGTPLVAEPLDLAGVYHAEGRHGTTGGPYGAEVTITKLGGLYRLQWRSGGRIWDGLGVVQANVLAGAILSPNGNGVIAYQIVPGVHGPVLQGRWAYAGETQVSTEILYLIRNLARDNGKTT